MIGIRSWGVHIPRYRLPREMISKAWGGGPAAGEKAVANFDEDSLTMATNAALECLEGEGPSRVGGLYFASTTPPYREKQAASVIAAALDLSRECMTVDFTGSLRSGTLALRAAVDAVRSGSVASALVVASDCRLAEPESSMERILGDGAAALLIDSEGVAAEVAGICSISDDFIGSWRRAEDRYIRSFDPKFETAHGYMRNVLGALAGLAEKCDIQPKDIFRAAVPSPDHRTLATVAKRLGLDPASQAQDAVSPLIGDTGTPAPFLLAIAALEEADAGRGVIMASYGDGSDAVLLRTTEAIKPFKRGRSLAAHLACRRLLPSYERYAKFRRVLERETGVGSSSPVVLWRDGKQIVGLHGHRCRECGHVQYPMGRICSGCGRKDLFDEVRLSRRGHIFTFTNDYLSVSPDPPTIQTVVDLEGGGRIYLNMTDAEPEEVRVGMPVELTFRKMHEGGDFCNYYWKSRPVIPTPSV